LYNILCILQYNMAEILYSYLETINTYPKDRQSIYISIGSAACRTEITDGIIIVKEENQQQFPLCMKNLKLLTYDGNMHIILIDPMLEDPPFITTDYTGKTLSNNWKKEINGDKSIEIYHEFEQNIHVYVLRKCICYPNYEIIEGYIDMTYILESFNSYAIINNVFLLIDDFTGKSIYNVFIYYKNQIKDHYDHIIYGITGESEGNCLINLAANNAQFVYKIDRYIKIFSPLSYENKRELLIYDIELMNEKDREIAIERCNTFFVEFKKYISVILSFMRRVNLLIKKEYVNDIKHEIIYYSKKYRENICILYDEKKYDELFNRIVSIFSNELKIYLSYFNNTEILEEIICTILSDHNPYNWSTILNKMIDF